MRDIEPKVLRLVFALALSVPSVPATAAMMTNLTELAAQGLGGSVCTPTTAVEGEINGLMTSDRKGLKLGAEKPEAPSVRAARAVIARFAGPETAETLKLEVIPDASGLPVYEIADGGRTVRGSSAVALTRGFYANCLAKRAGICSWSGNRFDAAAAFAPSAPVRRVSPFRCHQYFNVVTFGYSLPYWDERRWLREVDWMALHGFDMPLMPIAAEAIATRVWKRLGLTDAEIDEWLPGPAHLPWFRMGNLAGRPGKLPAAWRERSVRLQHTVLARMRELGMRPIGPAFAGFVPAAIRRIRPDLKVIKMNWLGEHGFHSDFLSPDQPAFREIGRLYVEEWEKEFGPFDCYLADSFNEMQIPWQGDAAIARGLADCGENIFGAIHDANPKATWAMQGWMLFIDRDFWTRERLAALLAKVPRSQTMIIDLAVDYMKFIANAREMNWEKFDGFLGCDWIYSNIPNMGGNTDFTGIMKYYANGHLEALQSPRKGKLVGMGLAPEGIENNEVIYELLADAGWRDFEIGLKDWLVGYSEARYGIRDDRRCREYWDALVDRGPYCMFHDHPKPWFQHLEDFDRGVMGELNSTSDNEYLQWEKALAALKAMEPEAGASPLYRADLAELEALCLVRLSDRYHLAEFAAWRRGDREVSKLMRERIRGEMLEMDRILAAHPLHRLDRWLDFARAAAEGDRRLAADYARNAALIVTVWEPPLNDYSARVWSGLIRDYYLPRLEVAWAARDRGENVKAAVERFEREWVERPR